MEVDEIHCKFPRISSNGDGKLAHGGRKMDDGEEEDGENKRGVSGVASAAALRGGPVDLGGGLGRFYGWPSSRIVRVSRASGGKDRHSKVLTSKGLRDRRVRLSVNTAIQFYDLQDRLGYDQPSKAVEWLLKAAAASIDELPPMNSPFPDTPKQLSDEKRSSTAGSDQFGFDSAEVDGGAGAGDPNFPHPQVAKSSAACSSTSETSKGSGLSLSRSESRIKARERAKGRVAEKEKEKENESSHVAGSMNHISQTTSFTELLSGGMNNGTGNNNGAAGDGNNTNESNFFLKSSPRHWSSTPMDYFTSGLLGQTSARSGQMHMTGGNPFTSPLFTVSTDHHHHHHHPELQQFSFVSDMSNNQNHDHHHHNGGDYNLNFSISSSSANSSGLAGYNRGTLQSNSSPPQSSSPSLLPHHHHQLQRFNSDGSPQGFYIGTAAAPVENHHPFQSGYDARLQLCYGDRQSAGQKGKGKN